MVREYLLRDKWQRGELAPSDLWVYPLPDRIGLKMDVDDGLIVEAVAKGSPAGKSGIEVGDALVGLDGQPLISTADIQWVLHTSPNDTTLAVKLIRSGQPIEKTVALKGDWKKSDIAWRASSWYGLRQGVKFEMLSESDMRQRGIDPKRMALLVKGLFGQGGSKVKESGLRQNDVIVGLDGRVESMTESEFLASLRLEHGPGDTVRLSVLRGKDSLELTIPMW
jgi:S1-C subfamily serine protease